LRHRRTAHPTPPAVAPDRGAHDRPSQPGEQDGRAAPSGGEPRTDNSDAQGDWGYLPPEPAGMQAVKGVVPLPLKKC